MTASPRRWLRSLILLGCASSGAFRAGDACAESTGVCDKTKPAEGGEPGCDKPTVEATFAFASAYVFRGDNVFQTSRQNEQNWVAHPRLVFTDGSDRLSIGYGSTYQLSGDNIQENVDRGVGNEQIVFASYDLTPAPQWVITPEVGTYVYPFAAAVPWLLEASTEVWYVGPIEVGAFVGYLGAVRPGPASENYFYFSPRVVKSFMIGTRLEFGIQLIAGAKLRTQRASADNTFDALAAEYLRYSVTDTFFVSVNAAIAWTNLGAPDGAATTGEPAPTFAQECAPFWGFALGAEL